MTEKKEGQEYAWEEIFSLDRLKRAMTKRVLDRLELESVWQGKGPMSPDQVDKVVNDEWQRAKEAVRNSPAARDAFRKYLERSVSEQIDKLKARDKDELEALGVVEKGL